MKSLWKPLALVALTALFVPGFAHATSSGSFIRFQADASAWICDCCPKTCGGGTLSGCFNNINMPPDAVTCTYLLDGKDFSCVSCMATTTATAVSAQDAFLQELARGADGR